MDSNSKPPQKRIEIKGVPKSRKTTLINIAENSGMTVSGLLKLELPKLIQKDLHEPNR